MTTQRVFKEVSRLQEAGEWDIETDLTNDRVLIHGVRLPGEWEPPTATALIELPVDYPAAQPQFYLEEGIRFTGEGLRPRQVAPPSTDGDVEWCPVFLPMEWDAEHDTLVTLVKLFQRL